CVLVTGIGSCAGLVCSVMEMKLNVTVGVETLHSDAVEIARHVRPHWTCCPVSVKVFTDGITNRLLGCYIDTEPDDMILIRVYGENTHLFIDRNLEIRNLKFMSSAGLSPPLLCTFQNGICYGYTPGDVLDQNLVSDPKVFRLITKNLAFMHCINVSENVNKEPCLFKVLRKYLKLIPDSYADCSDEIKRILPNKQQLTEEVQLLESHLSSMGSPVVFCHNDLLLKNIVRNKRKDVTFIDFEYADFNYQAFDIGNHFCEFAGVEKYNPQLYPDKSFQIEWIRSYLTYWNKLRSNKPMNMNGDAEHSIEEQIERLYQQVNKFSLAAHLLWGIWALIQAKHSKIRFDFLGYAVDRINEYFTRKQQILVE
ncbi:Ethanolamine kinase 1-like protein, partial [Leptotrombidium deliense]